MSIMWLLSLKTDSPEVESLVRIKVGDDPKDNPYVGFVSEAVGREYIRVLALERDCTVLPVDDIPVSAGFNPKLGVVMFDSVAQIAHAYAKQAEFPFGSLVRYATGYGTTEET